MLVIISTLFISLIAHYIYFIQCKNYNKYQLLFTIIFSVYFGLLLGSFAYEWYLEYMLNTFDLDGDGIFSEKESTLEQKKYMNLVTSDLGRNLLPITLIPYALIYSIIYVSLFEWYSKKKD